MYDENQDMLDRDSEVLAPKKEYEWALKGEN
jgi:hypothetical protein